MPKRAAKRLPIHVPETLEEAEAKQFARAFIARMREPGVFDSGHDAFDPEGILEWVRELIRRAFKSHPLWEARILDYAVHGSTAAHEVLTELIAEKGSNEPLGPTLATYNNMLLTNSKPHHCHGKSRVDNLMADIVIAVLVLQLKERFGLRPTRKSAWRPCGCSVVAEVLAERGLHRGDWEAIQKIWNRYQRTLLPGICGPIEGRNPCPYTSLRLETFRPQRFKHLPFPT
jgi:hypothetical protein